MIEFQNLHAGSIRDKQQQPKPDCGPADDLNCSQRVLDQRLAEIPGSGDRDRGDDEISRELAPVMAAAARRTGHTGDHEKQIAPEIERDRKQRAHVHGDIHHQRIFGKTHNVGNHTQMARGADRQELGEALNGGENKYFKKRHGVQSGHKRKASYSTAVPCR